MKRSCRLAISAVAFAATVTTTTTTYYATLRKPTVVHAATVTAPHFEVDPYWPKPLPNHWVLGSTIGLSTDSNDHVWIIHRPPTVEDNFKAADLKLGVCCKVAPPIIEFDQAGYVINSWGGPGPGYDWPESNHGITVNHKNNVWIAGNGASDTQVLKFTSTGKFLMQIGHHGVHNGSNDIENFWEPTKIFEEPGANEVYISDGYQVSLLDTGRDLLRMAEHAVPRSTALIIANPNYDEAVQGMAAGRQSSDFKVTQWPPLPGTHAEALAVREQLGGGAAELLEGTQASKSALLLAHGPRILHIATHGFFLPDQTLPEAPAMGSSRGTIVKAPQAGRAAPTGMGENPLLRSGIVLSGANLPEAAGGSILTALEAAQLDLEGTALVTLSACETGLGEITGGEGVFGLRRALTIAGAQAQLISLWKVDDKATAELMRVFYEGVAAGSGRAEALRAAQRELAVRYKSPYYWAAFTLSGNPGPIPAITGGK